MTQSSTSVRTLASTSQRSLAAVMGKTFQFMRHGATEHNIKGLRCGGDLDVELTALGREQAFRAAASLGTTRPHLNLIVASNLKRARQTAAIVSEVLGAVPVVVNPLLDERRMGDWNSLPVEASEAFIRDGMDAPNGEAEAVFLARVSVALHDLCELLDRQVLVVSSKGVGRAVDRLLGGEGALRLGNCEVVEFRIPRSTNAQPHIPYVGVQR